MRAAAAWTALGTYCGAIFAASAMPRPPGAQFISGRDKLVHAAAFLVMAALAITAARTTFRRWSAARCAGFGWLLASGYGVLDELHQMFTPGRTPDVRDALADAGGAAVAALVGYLWLRSREEPRSKEGP
jgi:VanZ family protein